MNDLSEHWHFSFHADEIGTISFPYLTLTLKSDDESIEEHEYYDYEVEEETPYLIEISKSDFENFNMSGNHESLGSDNESKRGKGKNNFLWQKSTKYIKTP